MNYLHKNDLPADVVLSGDIAVDTETLGLNLLRDRLCVVQLSDGSGDAHLVQFPDADFTAPNLKALLSDGARTFIFHFARFDVASLYKYLGVEIERVYCTKIASKFARTYTDQHGLKDLCRELLDVTISKQQQSSNWASEDLSDEQVKYAASDVLYLHALRDKLDAMLDASGRKDFAHRCFDFVPIRARMDLAGWLDMDIFQH